MHKDVGRSSTRGWSTLRETRKERTMEEFLIAGYTIII